MKRKMERESLRRGILITALSVGAATGVGALFRMLEFPETNVVVVYILSVILTARYTDGYRWGILATLLSTCAFNAFFTSPYFTLSVDDPSYFITFFIMAATSIITSALTSKARKLTGEAVQNEKEANALYDLTSRLANAESAEEIAEITAETVSRILRCRAACLCFEENGKADFLEEKGFWDLPIQGSESVLGVLRIPEKNAALLTGRQKALLHSMTESAAMAMDRLRAMRERIRTREEAEQERYRGNLLRAISHDLRTPLTGIMGTSEMLMGMTEPSDERYELAAGIYKDADWLHSLVENILNLTRLQDGRLILHKEQEPAEEIIGAAVYAIGKRAPEREIQVYIPDEMLLVPMDARLIGQVLTNLLDNAVKHTEPGEEISVTVSKSEDLKYAVFTVADRGTGISEEDLPNIFQMFYTTKGKGTDARRGIGLGLSICESIVTAHGGTIRAENQKSGKGAVFTFTLPLEAEEKKEHDETK